jgi:hypothetical protein
MAGRRKCQDLITQKEALRSKKHLKKLPEKRASAALAFPQAKQNLPVIVFFEDEARFGRDQQGNGLLGKEKYNTHGGQTDDQRIYLCLLGSIPTIGRLLFHD